MSDSQPEIEIILPSNPEPKARLKGPNKRMGEKGHNLRPSAIFDRAKKQEYIGLLAKTGRRCQSAVSAGVSVAVVGQHIRKDEEFEIAVKEALDIYRDAIDAEVGRRGVEGVIEDIYYQGVVVGQKVVYSDQLLLAHAKAHHPAYRDRMEVDKRITATVNLGLESLSEDDRAELRTILEKKEQERIERENSRSLNE